MMKIKIIWLLLNICILLYGIYLYEIHPDGAIALTYLMFIVSFPLGFFATYILFFISKFNFLETLLQSYPFVQSIIIPWIIFVIFGYIQWFIIFPKIRKYLKKM